MRDQKLTQSIDWTTIAVYFVMVIFGWINIYAAVFDPENVQSIFSFSVNSGKQLMWIGICIFLVITPIMLLDFRFYKKLAIPAYVISMISLVAVMFLARDIKGAQSWLEVGGVRIQPSEFAKVSTALALASFIDFPTIKLEKFFHHIGAFIIVAIPMGLIILQGDTGSALVFGAFFIVMYVKGLPPIYIILGLVLTFFFVLTLFFKGEIYNLITYILIGASLVSVGMVFGLKAIKRKFFHVIIILILTALLIFIVSTENYALVMIMMGLGLVASLVVILFRRDPSVFVYVILGVSASIILVMSMEFILTDVLQPHQSRRIEILINPELDPRGAGYQVNQSKIAIGSGGVFGKGFLEGTQTKFDFVPDQSTDFIFCTVGEEQGWMGSLIVIALFVTLIYRVVALADRQKDSFAQAYGYSVACIFFFHFMINIGMTIGLFPVIGIPLPFFSYGGSSLVAFTILLFILIKLDAHRMQVLGRKID
jgi:rod shape determining protein RodA